MNAVLKTALLPFALPFRLRFTAGTNASGALKAAEKTRHASMTPMVNYLGEHLADPLAAHEHVREYLALIPHLSSGDRIVVKASQIGMDTPGCGTWHAEQNLRVILETCMQHEIRVEIDMEDALRAEATVALSLFANGLVPTKTRVAISARMHKSQQFIALLSHNKIPVRLVKGAYEDADAHALQKPQDIALRYKELATLLLLTGSDPAFATHDQKLIEFVMEEAENLQVPKKDFEFQFLKGFRPRMQKRMRTWGYRVVVYLPYGPLWFEYGIRRWKFFRRNPVDLLRAIFG